MTGERSAESRSASNRRSLRSQRFVQSIPAKGDTPRDATPNGTNPPYGEDIHQEQNGMQYKGFTYQRCPRHSTSAITMYAPHTFDPIARKQLRDEDAPHFLNEDALKLWIDRATAKRESMYTRAQKGGQ